ncbi:MAG TPA: class I SAM-dependent methyltransferase, partial [candidate division Zixibacteria bacterium]|nr:class I SAM-dependent methyltransferase [candidate division Zixibacteria bacterium]
VLQTYLSALDLRRGARALEIGCGAGMVADYLAEAFGVEVAATDADPEQIALAESHFSDSPGVSFAVADATALPFAAESFDVAISLMTLHHIPRWDLALAEIARTLKPGGRAVLRDIALSAGAVALARPFKSRFGIYTADDALCRSEAHGLSVQEFSEPGGLLFSEFHLLLKKEPQRISVAR